MDNFCGLFHQILEREHDLFKATFKFNETCANINCEYVNKNPELFSLTVLEKSFKKSVFPEDPIVNSFLL